ncbi:MAG TPA: HIRAN domain-containing protein [Thermomicrobiales bacterium]|nr:HIRAN domain-containing protein [Thermomicrobiales bacterium]
MTHEQPARPGLGGDLAGWEAEALRFVVEMYALQLDQLAVLLTDHGAPAGSAPQLAREAVEHWRAANPRKGRIELTAILACEPDNPHDPAAVAVYVAGGRRVGHLSREDARAYQPLLQRLAAEGQIAACEALVIGGREEAPTFGMRIWLPEP